MRRRWPSTDPAPAHVREQLSVEPEAAAGFEAALRSAQLFLSGRERYKTNCIMVVHEMRMALASWASA